MKLYIAGIHHWDPLGLSKLWNWLEELALKYPNMPEFVAVEWDKNIFEQIRQRRPQLFKLVKSEWPNADPSFIDSLTTALGYEGDTHMDIFPNVRTLWLDRGRKETVPSPGTLVRMRFGEYKTCLENLDINIDFSEKTLLHMSMWFWKQADKDPNPPHRDAKFAKLLYNYMSKYKIGWAIAIVGAKHANSGPGSMRKLLEDKGVHCEVTELRPIPQERVKTSK